MASAPVEPPVASDAPAMIPLPMSAWTGAVVDDDAAVRLGADAEAVFAHRTGATFWRGLDAAPSCGLEALALAVARFHVANLRLGRRGRRVVGPEPRGRRERRRRIRPPPLR